jgi:hypothetical protein
MSTNQPYNNQNKNQPSVKPAVVPAKPANQPETAHPVTAKPAEPAKPLDASKHS